MTTVFVNVYEVDRIYGGPEEGGWWYDARTIIETREVSQYAVDDAVRELEEQYPNTGKVYSVIYDGGDYRVRVEDQPGANYPEKTPHYE